MSKISFDDFYMGELSIIISTLLLLLNECNLYSDKTKKVENIICYLCNQYSNYYNFFCRDMDIKSREKINEINNKYDFLNQNKIFEINEEKYRNIYIDLVEFLKFGCAKRKASSGLFSKKYKNIKVTELEKVIEKMKNKEKNFLVEEKRREQLLEEEKERQKQLEEERKRERIREMERMKFRVKLQSVVEKRDMMTHAFSGNCSGNCQMLCKDVKAYEIFLNKYNRMTFDAYLKSNNFEGSFIFFLSENDNAEFENVEEVYNDLDSIIIFNGCMYDVCNDYFLQCKNLNIENYKYLYLYLESSTTESDESDIDIFLNYKFYIDNNDNVTPFEIKLSLINNNVNVVNTVDANVKNTVSTCVENTVDVYVNNSITANVKGPVKVKEYDSWLS